MNSRNVTIVLIMALTNALLLSLIRTFPTEPDAKTLIYILIGCCNLFMVWLLFFSKE